MARYPLGVSPPEIQLLKSLDKPIVSIIKDGVSVMVHS